MKVNVLLVTKADSQLKSSRGRHCLTSLLDI